MIIKTYKMLLHLLFLSILSHATISIANEEGIISKNIPSVSTFEQNEDRVSIIQAEVQSLMGRIEILEHTVSELKKQVDVSSSHSTVLGTKENEQNTVNKDPITQSEPVNKSAQDDEKVTYDKALIALKDGKYNEAEIVFQDFISKYPKSSLISNAYFWYGETFFKRNDFEKAALQYLRCYKQYPKSKKAPDSLLKLGISLGEMGKTKEACAMLSKLNKEFKDRPASSIKRAKDAINKYGCK